MLDSRAAGLLATGVVSALALGGLGTFLRRLPDSTTLAPTVAVFALVVVAVALAVLAGTRSVPDETAYWQ
jgi:lipopolysaccharide export LptBFGC system permease protein LptF